MRVKFDVVEYPSGYAVRENRTGKEHWLSDGVDVLFDAAGNPRSPGTECFRRDWQRALNADAAETKEAYFPEEQKRGGAGA